MCFRGDEMSNCKLRVLHAASNLDKLNIKISETSIPLHYKSNSEYLSFKETRINIKILKDNTNEVVHSQDLILQPHQAYTIAVTNLLPILSIFEDETYIADGEAAFRFINLSSIESIDIIVKNTGDTTFKQLLFHEATEYLAVYPIKVDFELRSPITKEPLLTLPTIRFPIHASISFYIIGNKDSLDIILLKRTR